MTYSIDVEVLSIGSDFDFQGEPYVQVTLGYKLPSPANPIVGKINQATSNPKQILYKHALHIFIPRSKWAGQYTVWQECHLIIKDDGALELKKKEV